MVKFRKENKRVGTLIRREEMKKIIAAIICVAMVFSFTGCGGNAGGGGEPVAQLTNLSSEAQTLGEEAVSLVREWMDPDNAGNRDGVPDGLQDITDSLYEIVEDVQGDEEKDTLSLWIALVEVKLDIEDTWFLIEESSEVIEKSLSIVEGKLGLKEVNYEVELGYEYQDLGEEAREEGMQAVKLTYLSLNDDLILGGIPLPVDELYEIEDKLMSKYEELEESSGESYNSEASDTLSLATSIGSLAFAMDSDMPEIEGKEKSEYMEECLQDLVQGLGLA